MLHEVLLALSGHPSPVLGNNQTDTFPLLSSAESELLSSLGRLATLHRALRAHLPRISAHHPSLICRALASTISSTHLTALQNLILDTERQILAKDASIVGAYEIVPLASILNKFEPWKRKLDWFWEMSCFIYSADAEPLASSVSPSRTNASTGPAILSKLRLECRTGYPDIEEVALDLLTVGERTWVRQLSNWLMHRSSIMNRSWDFFVTLDENFAQGTARPVRRIIAPDMVPDFVTKETAQSILFIGRTLQMLQSESSNDSHMQMVTSLTPAMVNMNISSSKDILPLNFFEQLLSLSSPILPAVFSGVISSLRAHVATTLVNEILPMNHFVRTLGLFRKYFLAGDPHFTDLLIAEADRHIAVRHEQTTRGVKGNLGNRFVGAVLKDAEVSGVLSKTWSALGPSVATNAAAEENLEWAREHLLLRIPRPGAESEPLPAFEGFLLHSPTLLSVQLASAFDLLLTSEDVAIYSSIHSYLTAIRRTHNHVADLWRQTQFRRDHPAPVRRGRSSKAFPIIREKRRRTNRRMLRMRGVWTVCTSTSCLLAALGDFLVGEVVEQSWNRFHAWTVGHDSEPSSAGQSKELPRDPEVLALGHRQYLEGLLESLLLSDQRYIALLKSLLEYAEQVVAYVRKLGDVQRSIDLHEEGVLDGSRGKLETEEQDTSMQLDQGCGKLANSLDRLKEHLRKTPMEAQPQHRPLQAAAMSFEPYSSTAGLNRLLSRLEAGLVPQSEGEDGVEVPNLSRS